jgi:NDP-sugar pyrophosphorylase family protein
MKAMIFAAGKGTRLQPLTNNTPKALIELNRVPMLERVIMKLRQTGVSEIIINIHYLADQIIDFLKSKNNFDIHIEISDESDELLDTGGGLKKASHFFKKNEPFILYNVDIESNIDLNKMLDMHISSKAIATLAVRERISSRYFLFNDKMELNGWKNTKTDQEIITKQNTTLSSLAFSGIHIINPEIFDFMNKDGKFSIVNTYLEVSKTEKIMAYNHTLDYWFDIGNVENLKKAEDFLSKN